MHIKSIVAGAAIALVAGVGSVSGNELNVADTAVDPGTPYAVLDGIATEQMSALQMNRTRGQGGIRVFVDGAHPFPANGPLGDVVNRTNESPLGPIDIVIPAGIAGF